MSVVNIEQLQKIAEVEFSDIVTEAIILGVEQNRSAELPSQNSS